MLALSEPALSGLAQSTGDLLTRLSA
jgi:hypothetical protein